jgi:hypothetical protein
LVLTNSYQHVEKGRGRQKGLKTHIHEATV